MTHITDLPAFLIRVDEHAVGELGVAFARLVAARRRQRSDERVLMVEALNALALTAACLISEAPAEEQKELRGLFAARLDRGIRTANELPGVTIQ